MVTISTIIRDSPAGKAGLRTGDRLVSINGEEVRDALDFELMQSSEELDMVVARNSSRINIRLYRTYGESLGIEPEIMKIRTCKCNCVFCFVHQMPRGLRRSMYIKDEDYRYSFLDGNFITLSNMREPDWKRIAEQRLSPLYISVHATNPELRHRIMGFPLGEPVLESLQRLKDNDILFHTQLVIVPGWNDKEELERSIEDLMGLYPSILSISIVPVGLTSHRRNLVPLEPFGRQDAVDCLERAGKYIVSCKERFGKNLVFPSDEVYLRAGANIPESDFYGSFSQYENGVGMIRSLLDEFERELPDLPEAPEDWKVTVLTAASAGDVLRNLMVRLNREKGLHSETIICENLTFGRTVTVTGLLCGKDLLQALGNSCLKGPILIPPECLNREKVFLDDLHLSDLEKQSGRKVIVPASFREFFPQ